MTHQIQSTDLQGAVQLLADNGFEGMADAIQILFNEAMKIERTQYIGAEPYSTHRTAKVLRQRIQAEDRQLANGKARTESTANQRR